MELYQAYPLSVVFQVNALHYDAEAGGREWFRPSEMEIDMGLFWSVVPPYLDMPKAKLHSDGTLEVPPELQGSGGPFATNSFREATEPSEKGSGRASSPELMALQQASKKLEVATLETAARGTDRLSQMAKVKQDHFPQPTPF